MSVSMSVRMSASARGSLCLFGMKSCPNDVLYSISSVFISTVSPFFSLAPSLPHYSSHHLTTLLPPHPTPHITPHHTSTSTQSHTPSHPQSSFSLRIASPTCLPTSATSPPSPFSSCKTTNSRPCRPSSQRWVEMCGVWIWVKVLILM